MSKRPQGARLAPRLELGVYLAWGALALTGSAWLLLHNFARAPGEFGDTPHPAEHPMLVAHGVASYVVLVLAGALFASHVPPAWRYGRNRKSGLTLLALAAIAAVTALGLYYLSNEGLRAAASLAHWLAGLASLALLTLHAVRGRAGEALRSASPTPRTGRRSPSPGRRPRPGG